MKFVNITFLLTLVPTTLEAFSLNNNVESLRPEPSLAAAAEKTIDEDTQAADTAAKEDTTTTPEVKDTSTDLPAIEEEITKSMFDDFVDEDELFAKSTFPIKPDALMDRARYILSSECSIGTKDGGECLGENFEFIAQVIGPLGREEYLGALTTFNLEEAFDITPNFFGLSVDPIQPNRVWFFNRVKATHTNTFMNKEPTPGKTDITYPPQILHIDFNEDGKVKEFGFYTADRRQGNTGGLGGAFGFMRGIGVKIPIREFNPYKPSFRFRAFNLLGSLARKFGKKKD